MWHRPGTHPGSLGEHNARDAPCTKPAVCPAQWRAAGQARSHRLRSTRNATRRPDGVGRCGAVVSGDRVGRRSSAKGAQELHRLRMGHELRRHPRHCGTGLLRPTGDRRDLPSIKARSDEERDRCVTHWCSDGTTAPRAGAPAREGVLLVCFTGGVKTSMKASVSRVTSALLPRDDARAEHVWVAPQGGPPLGSPAAPTRTVESRPAMGGRLV